MTTQPTTQPTTNTADNAANDAVLNDMLGALGKAVGAARSERQGAEKDRVLAVLRAHWPESGGQTGHALALASQDACADEILRVLTPGDEK